MLINQKTNTEKVTKEHFPIVIAKIYEALKFEFYICMTMCNENRKYYEPNLFSWQFKYYSYQVVILYFSYNSINREGHKDNENGLQNLNFWHFPILADWENTWKTWYGFLWKKEFEVIVNSSIIFVKFSLPCSFQIILPKHVIHVAFDN